MVNINRINESPKEDCQHCHQSKTGRESNLERETEAFGRYKDIAGTNHRHKQGGQESYPITFSFLGEPHRSRPQHNAGKGLIGPGKVAPEDREIDEEQACRDGKKRQTKHKALADALLAAGHAKR